MSDFTDHLSTAGPGEFQTMLQVILGQMIETADEIRKGDRSTARRLQQYHDNDYRHATILMSLLRTERELSR